MDLGVHLPLMQLGHEALSPKRLVDVVDAARKCGFAAVAANDHFVFATPWLDGPTALASMIERSGEMNLATTVSLAALRGPVPLAKALAALDLLSEGRLIAALGPGSSGRDYEALGLAFEERWARFEEAVIAVRALLNGGPRPESARYWPLPSDLPLEPAPGRRGGVPLWIGSWGSKVGLRRVARLADGWLASAYNTTPERFAESRERLSAELAARDRSGENFPNALATMWTWVTQDRAEADRVLAETLAPLLRRDPDELRAQLCVGSAEHCAELLSRYAQAGCEHVYLWPLGDERAQIELVAGEVAPRIERRRPVRLSGRR
jgi:alkanesulfonate monooxygenase SsuD/methylene tetrahydromethanopterin reductase-like flavin-dependent oxidoreductase (luciferase family)